MRAEKNLKIYEYVIICTFVAVGAAMSLIASYCDFFSEYDTTSLKYCGIALCACFALYSTATGKKFAYIVFAALGFTLVADYFLLVKNEYYDVGVSAFIIAQTCYFIKIYLERGRFPSVSLAVRSLAFVAASACLFILKLAEPLTVLAAAYAVSLLGNVVESYFNVRFGVGDLIFAVGLTAFACCDVCVLAFNLGDFIDIPLSSSALDVIVNLAWVFYLPSQIAISLSSAKLGDTRRLRR